MKSKKRILTRSDVVRIARLARLNLSHEEVDLFTSQLTDVLGYFEKLSEADTNKIQPTYHPVETETRLQEQPPAANTLKRDAALAPAREKKDGYILTDSVLDSG